MIRTQVQLTDRQLKALKHAAAASARSISDLVREGVDQYLSGRSEIGREERIERAIRAAGAFSSGQTDVSANHDRHLAEAFRH
jgi:hypothetical protein